MSTSPKSKISFGKDKNYFKKADITSTDFQEESDVLINIKFINSIYISNTGLEIIEYSFNGITLHGLIISGTSLSFNKNINKIWFRAPDGPSSVSINAYSSFSKNSIFFIGGSSRTASEPEPEPEPEQTLGLLMNTYGGFAWDEADIAGASGSGTSGVNGEALTGWADTTGEHIIVPSSGTPVRNLTGFGPPTFSDEHTVASHGRPSLFCGINRAAACDDAEVGTLMAGTSCPPFCFWTCFQIGGTTSANNTVAISWGAPFYSGTASDAPYIAVQASTSNNILRFQFTGGTSERLNINLSENDQQSYTLLVVSRGHGQPMLIRLMRNGVWSTIVNSASFNIADGANTNLVGLTRLAFGGLYAGSTTNSAEATRSNRIYGYGQCIPPADDTERASFITELEGLLFDKFSGPTNQILTDRQIIISSTTTGFNPPATITGNNIMSPCLFELSGFKLLFGDHDGIVVTQANCSGSPLVPANWSVVSAGTGINTDSLEAAGGYTNGNHVSSPEVVSLGGGEYTLFVHGQFAEFNHHTFAIRGTSFTGGEGITWDWANNAEPLSTASDAHVYMRSFRYGGRWYGVTNGAILLTGPTEAEASDGVGTYTEIADEELWYGPLSGGLAGTVRHCGVLVLDDTLFVAYTCTNEYEHIKLAVANLAASSNPNNWRLVHPVTGTTTSEYSWIWPYLDNEGASLYWDTSETGAVAERRRQLRDPQFYKKDDTIYLLWAARGEDSIVIADATTEITNRLAELPF